MSYLYPGTSGNKIVAAAPVLTPVQHTIVAWIKPNSLPATFGCVGLLATFPTGILLHNDGNITVLETFGTTSGDWHGVAGITTGAWIAVAVTYDGSSTANNPSVYTRLEGASSLTSLSVVQDIAPVGSFITVADAWCCGGVSTSYPFDGKIAYLQLFDRILSAPELNAAVSNPGSVTSGLLVHWAQMDDPSDGAFDSSGNGNTGTVSGGVTLDADNPSLPTGAISVLFEDEMTQRLIPRNTTSFVDDSIMLRGTDGKAKSGITHSDITANYVRKGISTAIVLSAASFGDAWSSGAIGENGSTGQYQLSYPNTVVATGSDSAKEVTIYISGANILDKEIHILLTDYIPDQVDPNIGDIKTQTDKIPASPAAIGSKMDLQSNFDHLRLTSDTPPGLVVP